MTALLFIAALVAGAVGLGFAFADPQMVVGGDAFNFIIAVGRGVLFACVGVILAALGVASLIYERSQVRPASPPQSPPQ